MAKQQSGWFRKLETNMKVVLRSVAGLLLAGALFGPAAFAQSATPRTAPKIDKPAVTRYLRYAEGFTPTVEIVVDDPKPSAFSGFYQLTVHLKAGKNEAVRNYYLTSDGSRLISGSVFDLKESPFKANLEQLKPESAPATGRENAPVQIYVFSDFQCPYCREEAKVLRQGIEKNHASEVRVIFKDFPLDAIHPWARTAAHAGHCIARQNGGTFWTFHDWIYDHQTEIKPENVKDKMLEFAKGQKLDADKFSACLADPATDAYVNKTVAEGRQLGVQQTPTMFVNGRMLSGALSAEQMNLLIQMELEHRQQHTASAMEQKCCQVAIPRLGGK
jgi:protein-disulfide isomerase